jgi:hypothetical protein
MPAVKMRLKKREIKVLLKDSELLKCKDLFCITWDYEDEIKINLSEQKVKILFS